MGSRPACPRGGGRAGRQQAGRAGITARPVLRSLPLWDRPPTAPVWSSGPSSRCAPQEAARVDVRCRAAGLGSAAASAVSMRRALWEGGVKHARGAVGAYMMHRCRRRVASPELAAAFSVSKVDAADCRWQRPTGVFHRCRACRCAQDSRAGAAEEAAVEVTRALSGRAAVGGSVPFR